MISDPLLGTQAIPGMRAESEIEFVSPEKQFIQFSLTASTPLLLSVLHLVEILTVPIGQVVPVFQMPPWVMGVYNWRGDILWMVDLNHLGGFSPWYQQKGYASKHTVIIVQYKADQPATSDKQLTLGLVVNQVENMVICEPEDIHPLAKNEVPVGIESFLQGSWSGSTETAHWILNIETIIQTMAVAN